LDGQLNEERLLSGGGWRCGEIHRYCARERTDRSEGWARWLRENVARIDAGGERPLV